ncbi:hypothetical protein JRC04_04455 [Mycolicibacterium sp. S2-37]|uniref:hypothetical protein n=1 Tax=Mycolicibacterium sp. S2-37 TaxID=2810297 RepID=UPI001A951B8D|nr:hypothetical protein [Mycolicibacterium sp. S2-37]MBO0676713.1 hypothetical protein [Mycolicibacterium sp. S2-37]
MSPAPWAVAAVSTAVLTGVLAAPAAAQEPVGHHVRYTVTAEQPTKADIYYRDAEPANWADYSHNPYVFSPRAEVNVGPDQPWVLDVFLVDPARWAMVTATNGLAQDRPNFRCELTVDGEAVAEHLGPKGALCSLRHW